MPQTLWVLIEGLIKGCAIGFLLVHVVFDRSFCGIVSADEIEPDQDVFVIRNDSDIPVT